MRLIDADALSATMAKYIEENRNESDLFLNGCADGAYHYQFAVDHAQTIAERKTGRWKYNTAHGYYGCTNCNHRIGFGAVLDMGGLPCACPWCDAKMEVDE